MTKGFLSPLWIIMIMIIIRVGLYGWSCASAYVVLFNSHASWYNIEGGMYRVDVYFGVCSFLGGLEGCLSSSAKCSPFAPWIHSPPVHPALCPGKLACMDCISWAPLPSFPAGFSQREAQWEITAWGRVRLGCVLPHPSLLGCGLEVATSLHWRPQLLRWQASPDSRALLPLLVLSGLRMGRHCPPSPRVLHHPLKVVDPHTCQLSSHKLSSITPCACTICLLPGPCLAFQLTSASSSFFDHPNIQSGQFKQG